MTQANFLADSIALFAGEKAAHMGAHQYCDHVGARNGRSMSGAALWTQADAERERAHKAGDFNKAGAEIHLLGAVAESIAAWMPPSLEVIELGPGTLRSFQTKTLPILKALNRTSCTIVDSSPAFLQNIQDAFHADDMAIRAIEDDFFLGGAAYQTECRPALLCSFGGIISNMIAPLGTEPSASALVSTLQVFAEKIRDGYVLLAFDSNPDGHDVLAYYAKHALFQVNIFDRMAAELPMTGDFDPAAFAYTPEWIENARQLGHIVTASRPLSFTLGARDFRISRGQKFHIKNSFKFTPAFFERCCRDAGLMVLRHWAEHRSHCFLLGKTRG